MVNKTLKKKVQAKPATSKSVSPVVDSVRELWFAGLGVFSVAQAESGRLIDQGNKFFDKLVAEGARLEKRTRSVAETAVEDIKGEVESQFDIAKQQIVDNWDGLGTIFDERVLGTLDRLGIPTTKELNKLSIQIERMSNQAVKNWKELEAVFEKRVAAVLKKLDVPNADDLGKLSDNVKKVSGNWEKLESVVEGRINETLGGLGIPTADDISKLSSELQKLSRQVAAMEAQLKAKANPGVPEATGKKPLAPEKIS